MSDFDETAALPQWVLYQFPGGKRAQICCKLKDDSRMTELPGRLARIIVWLQQAYQEDKRLPFELRGFRRAEELAKICAEDPLAYPVEPVTITSYLSKLCKRLKKPAPTGEPFPLLILRVKNCGAKLLYPVEIQLAGCSVV